MHSPKVSNYNERRDERTESSGLLAKALSHYAQNALIVILRHHRVRSNFVCSQTLRLENSKIYQV